jgi:hypothetical protein
MAIQRYLKAETKENVCFNQNRCDTQLQRKIERYISMHQTINTLQNGNSKIESLNKQELFNQRRCDTHRIIEIRYIFIRQNNEYFTK